MGDLELVVKLLTDGVSTIGLVGLVIFILVKQQPGHVKLVEKSVERSEKSDDRVVATLDKVNTTLGELRSAIDRMDARRGP